MNHFKFLWTIYFISILVGCKTSTLNQQDASMEAAGTAKQPNYPPFDAYLIWSTGKGLSESQQGVYEYPSNYQEHVPHWTSAGSKKPEPKADGVFFVDSLNDKDPNSARFINFSGPTPGISISDIVTSTNVSTGVITYPTLITGGILSYPANGSQKGYQLKFIVPQNLNNLYMSHIDAQKVCKNLGLRLPTIRELFDYCHAGFAWSKPSQRVVNEHRCQLKVWSASAAQGFSASAHFISQGFADTFSRAKPSITTMCVGNSK